MIARRAVLTATSLALLTLTACSQSTQSAPDATIDNAPSASAVASESTSQAPESTSATATEVSSPTPSSDSRKIKDHPQEVMNIIASLSNANLSPETMNPIADEAGLLGITFDKSMTDFYSQSDDDLVRLIKQVDEIKRTEDGNVVTFDVNVYMAQAVVYAQNSPQEVQKRLSDSMIEKSKSDPSALSRAKVTYTLTIDESGEKGVLSVTSDKP